MKTAPWEDEVLLEVWKDEVRTQGDHPCVNVTYNQCMDFATKFSRLSGVHARLPTDVEWERAVRGGTDTQFFWGNEARDGRRHAWLDYDRIPIGEFFIGAVARLKPNPFGLYDMVGLVAEYTLDRFWSPPSTFMPAERYTQHTDWQVLDGDCRFIRSTWIGGSPEAGASSHRIIRPVDFNEGIDGFRLVVAGQA